ncbi:S-layer homology domain-containing protein [Hominicoprocola fusiformis]
MKKRILSILLVCCMVLTMLPTAAFAAGGAVRPAATQYTYTLHYDANGGSGAPPSQSETSSELSVWIPISEKIPTRDGYTFKGWADSPNEKPKYLREEGYYWNYLMVHPSLSETIYAIWEVHDHNWGEWISNGNGTHTRTCTTDSSHTETGNCSGGKATSTEKAICETCHTAYGELLQPVKTVITTPPTLRLPAYVGNEYTDAALMGGEAKAERTGVIVPGTFRFKHDKGGKVYPGENRMVILFTPDDEEAYTTAECIVTVMGTKRTITSVPYDVYINDKLPGTVFEDLGLPSGVNVETNTGAHFSPIPVTWDSSTYDPNRYGEQIITGELHVEKSRYTDQLEPTSTVRATARITLIDNRVFTPTLEPPTYSKQLYGGDLCFLVFSDKYLSDGTATANGQTVSGKFTLDKDQKIYGHSLTASTLLRAGQLQLKVIFTPDNPKRYTSAECTVDVNVVPRTFVSSDIVHIPSKKIGTTFEELNLSDSFDFYAVGDENDPNGTGSNYDMPVVTSWDASTYDPNSFDEQTIYGEVDRAELEKYFTIPEGADLRAVRKVQLQPDPAETEITQLPVFQWKNGDFTLPDNTIFTWRRLQVKPYNDEVGTLVGGVARVKGTDTVAPGTFSFKKAPPFYLQTPGEHDVTVVFTPDDPRLHKPTETTIKINAIKNTIKDIDEPDPITDKSIGTPFAELGLPENVCINGVDGAWRWIEAAWNESSYNAQSPDWQTITGSLVLDEDADSIFQQPEPAVTANIRVKLIAPPTITTQTLPGGAVGTPYNHQLHANGGGLIEWEIISGALPESLHLNETTGVISGTPTAVGTATFTVRAVTSVGSDKKELSITITKPQQYGRVSMDDYVYGETPSTPSLTDRTGDGSVAYYYSTTNSNSGGTKWENIQADTPNAGTYYMYAELGETENYGSFTTACVKFQVLRAIPTCTKPTGLTAIYGQTLADVTLPDGWNWMNSSESVGNASTAAKKFKAKFTPADTTNYNTVEDIELEVMVNKANQAPLTIQGADGVVYGQTLTLTTTGGSGMGAVTYRIDTAYSTGGAAIDPNTGVLTPAKVGSVSVVATKAGDNDYNDITSAPFVLMIKPATPTGEPKYTKITTSGKTLKDAALTTNGSTLNPNDGKLEWVDDKGNALPDDTKVEANKTYKWRFTPTDTNYTPLTGEIELYHKSGGGGGYNPPVTYYTLRFETGGGSDIPSVREAYNAYIDLTKYVPTWRGHTFIGWYSERSLMNKVSGVYLTKDMTVYAGWRVDENPGTGANPFTDVSEKDWFYGDVMFVCENGLMLGTSKALFSPYGTATRGMMATILWRMEGSPVPKGKNSFTDVEAGKWYADAVTWTAENGIFAGYGKDKFGPDDPITREQLASIFYRYADYKGYDLTAKGILDTFKDTDKITDYAKTAMQWAVSSGLVKGKSGNLLDPQGTATRAEIAAMLHRFIEKYELVQGKAPGGLMGWIDPKHL